MDLFDKARPPPTVFMPQALQGGKSTKNWEMTPPRLQKRLKNVKKSEKGVARHNHLASLRASTAGAIFKVAPRKGPFRRAFIIGSDSG